MMEQLKDYAAPTCPHCQQKMRPPQQLEMPSDGGFHWRPPVRCPNCRATLKRSPFSPAMLAAVLIIALTIWSPDWLPQGGVPVAIALLVVLVILVVLMPDRYRLIRAPEGEDQRSL